MAENLQTEGGLLKEGHESELKLDEEHLNPDHSNAEEKKEAGPNEDERPGTPIDEEKKKEILEEKRAGKFVQKKTKGKLFQNLDQFSKLEKYRELDRNHPLNRPFQGDAAFRGPICKLRCFVMTMISQKEKNRLHLDHYFRHI